jgi:hypothetical protein
VFFTAFMGGSAFAGAAAEVIGASLSADGAATTSVLGDYPASSSSASFFEGTTYSEKVASQMQSGVGEFHSFPGSVEAFGDSGTVSDIVGGDGTPYQMMEIPGSYTSSNGGLYDGVFQFVKTPDNVITHRLFVPNP